MKELEKNIALRKKKINTDTETKYREIHISEEQKKKQRENHMLIKPSGWVEKFCTVNIRTPFKFVEKLDNGNVMDRSYLLPIYDNDNRELLFKASRQTEKSTLISNKIMIQTCMYHEPRAVLYVAPRKKQMEKFSNQKIKPLFEINEKISRFWWDSKLTNKVSEKMTKTGSIMYLEYAFLSADGLRGISAQDIMIDEIQDQIADNIIVIEEAASHYMETATKLYAGTCKTFDSPLEQYWNISTQNEWEVYCHHCGHMQILDYESCGPQFICCKKCKKEINPRWGRWTTMCPGKRMIGYRVCQLMVPWLDYKKDILDKMARYPKGKFYNEVLALPYDHASKLFTVDILRRNCDENYTEWFDKYIPEEMPLDTFAGIDVGRAEGEHPSYTTLCITTKYKHQKTKLLYGKIFNFGYETDPEYQIEFIIKKCLEFKVTMIGIDFGDSFVFANKIIKKFGDKRVVRFFWSGPLMEKMKWDGESKKYVVNRTQAMSDVRNDIDANKWIFPRWELFEPYAKNLLAVNIDRYSNNAIKYDHSVDQPDDFYHSMCYADLCMYLFYKHKRSF